jgi:hypothetical protein
MRDDPKTTNIRDETKASNMRDEAGSSNMRGDLIVIHEANQSSGGCRSEIAVEVFL